MRPRLLSGVVRPRNGGPVMRGLVLSSCGAITVAKRKKDQLWEVVFDRVRSLYWPHMNYPSKPTAADLDAAEQQLGFKFPLSYRAFAERFGLNGYLCCSLPRMMPLTPPSKKDTHWSSSVVTATDFFHTSNWHEEQGWDEELPPPEFLKRIIVFAQDGGYHD